MNTQYLTIPQVAEKLNVCENTVRKWVKQKILKHLKVKGIVRIRENDLAAFEDKHYVKSIRQSRF